MTHVPERSVTFGGGWKKTSSAVLALGMLLVSSSAFAQLNLGHIIGAVTDQTGGAIAGAVVTVTDVSRGISRPLTTDSAGEYNAPSLIPGTYTVSAAAKGFKTEERQNIVVGVGDDVRVDLNLQPGETTQTVTVTESVPMVNTADAQLGATVENQVINDLPLEGRLYTKLLDFRPGMSGVPGGKTPTYSSNGIRANDNEWLFDGLDDVNVYGATGPTVSGNNGFDQITILPVDAIQEIKIIENPKAEYGWRPGAQVNVGLKSGTNDIHGTAYAFGRDTDLDAKNQFLGPNLPRAADALEQPGVTIGGPIKKDKLFFFAGYEGKRFVVGSPRTQQMPSSLPNPGTPSPSTSFPDAIAAMNTAHQALSPLSLSLAGCNSAGVCNPANGLFNNAGPATEVVDFNSFGSSDNAIGKIDYHPNDHNALNGEYFFGNGAQVSGAGSVIGGGGGAQPYWLSVDDGKAQVVRGVWVWTPNSNWVNEARFGYDRYNQPVFPQACIGQASQPSLGALGLNSGLANTDLQCGPSISITSFASLGAGAGMTILSQQWAGLDSVSYTHGKHQFKFGGEVRNVGCACAALLTNLQGTVSFGGSVSAFSGATALEDFLAGVPSSGAVLLGPVNRNLSNNRFAGFAQDDWRVASRVILNLGLRYEYETAMTEKNNLLGNFDPNTPSGLIQATSSDRTVYKAYPWNFAPRFGMAWDVFGKGTTVVRLDATILDNTAHAYNALDSATGTQLGNIPTGFALFNATGGTTRQSPGNLNSGTLSLSSGQFPWAANTPIFNATSSGLACGNGLGSVNPMLATNPTTNAANPAPCKIVPMNPNFRDSYITSWGLDIQQAITNNLTLDVAYVGNHGSQLSEQLDINQPTPGLANGKASAANEEAGEAQLTRSPYYSQFPYFSQIVLYTNGGVSNYNSLQVKLIQRLSRGATFTAGYTLDHSLDIASSELSNQPMNSYDPQLDYGNSSGIPFQHFTLTASYVIPGRKFPGQMLEGWQINTALNLLGALPVNADDTTDNLSGTGENEDRWTLAGPASGFKGFGGPSQVPCYGVAAGNETINGSSIAFVQSSFSKTTNCISVAPGGMPAACVNAAAGEPNSPSNSGVPTAGAANTALFQLYTLGCYYQNGSAIVPPAQGTYGTMGRDVLQGLPFREWDFSVVKDWKWRERYSAQFRVEFFNFLNSPAYAAAATNLGSPSTFGESTALPNSTNPIIGNGGPRVVQLGLKLGF
jgi:hypothetical protein